MVPEMMNLDPKLEELLREIAAEPDSCLLKMPRARALPALFERGAIVRASSSALNAFEREVLRVHRSELAAHLLRACAYKILEGDKTRHRVNRHARRDQPAEIESPKTSQASIQRIAEDSAAQDELADARDLLLHCVREPLGPTPGACELAAAAHRLVPSNEARLWAAVDLALGDQLRSALRLAHDVLEGFPSETETGCAWDSMTFAWEQIGNLGRALEAAEAGGGECPSRLSTHMNAFILGFQVGSRRSVELAARRLEEIVSVDHPAVESFAETTILRRQEGQWKPTREALALKTTLRDNIGTIGRRIQHVIA